VVVCAVTELLFMSDKEDGCVRTAACTQPLDWAGIYETISFGANETVVTVAVLC
jgi:hypothetical protein